MTQQVYDNAVPGFKLDMAGYTAYQLICKTDGAIAVRRVGRFTCPICGSNVSVKAVKCAFFWLIYGGGMSIHGTVTGRTVTSEPNMLEFERSSSILRKTKAFNYAVQANFAELEVRALALQHGKVAPAAAELPNHEEELSEKDDDAGRNDCPGACLYKPRCSNHKE